MAIKKDLVSKRYRADGIPLVVLSDFQKKNLQQFLHDTRITYNTILECPLCKDRDAILVAEKDKYSIPLETVVCENCGLLRSYKQLDEESLMIFYSEYYRKIYDAAFNIVDNNLLHERYEAGAKIKIPNYVTKDKVILEIGCGGGWNLMPFHKSGYTYYGFDLDKELLECGKSRGLNLFLGDVEEAVKMGIKCDYLSVDQVLEHVCDPIDFLVSLKPLLHENAIVDIYVPSLDLLLWGYSDYDLLKTLQNAHNFLYDEFTLRGIGTHAGFEIINCVATNLVLRNSGTTKNLTAETTKFGRGEKIVKYLKLVEKTLLLRKKIGIENVSFKKLYCFVRPLRCYKKLSLKYFGSV